MFFIMSELKILMNKTPQWYKFWMLTSWFSVMLDKWVLSITILPLKYFLPKPKIRVITSFLAKILFSIHLYCPEQKRKSRPYRVLVIKKNTECLYCLSFDMWNTIMFILWIIIENNFFQFIMISIWTQISGQ